MTQRDMAYDMTSGLICRRTNIGRYTTGNPFRGIKPQETKAEARERIVRLINLILDATQEEAPKLTARVEGYLAEMVTNIAVLNKDNED